MSFLYVVTAGATVHKRGESFLVEGPDGKRLAEIEARRLKSAVILSSVQVTTQALAEMLEHEIELAILSGRGKLLGQLTPPLSKNIDLRLAQFDRENDSEFTLIQAKRVVLAKLENQRQVLVRHTLDEPGHQPEAANAAAAIADMLEQVEACQDMETLRGLEGICARHYWAAFGSMLKVEGVGFTGRRKRPPPDPVNAVLSFGYVLLGSLLHSFLDGLGFDPFLGFFHTEAYGRPSLALDILEPLRAPVVDRFTLRSFNLGVLKAEDFRPDNR
ncbi:MAG: CRISPR-associated endonuclease Cas1, partial [Deltaproteobacteria bacterium]|nr:CRISPR-associated endonuclease Cas1 [Deltaproteobacteria bacterium]